MQYTKIKVIQYAAQLYRLKGSSWNPRWRPRNGGFHIFHEGLLQGRTLFLQLGCFGLDCLPRELLIEDTVGCIKNYTLRTALRFVLRKLGIVEPTVHHYYLRFIKLFAAHNFIILHSAWLRSVTTIHVQDKWLHYCWFMCVISVLSGTPKISRRMATLVLVWLDIILFINIVCACVCYIVGYVQ